MSGSREIRNAPAWKPSSSRRLQQTREALQLVETRLGYASIVAPLSGVVLTDSIEAGEFVAPGTPVVTVGDLHHVWLRGYVDETDLGRVKVGHMVPGHHGHLSGQGVPGSDHLHRLRGRIHAAQLQTTKERVKLVYRIKVDIPNPDMELQTGHASDGVIDTAEAGR